MKSRLWAIGSVRERSERKTVAVFNEATRIGSRPA